MWRWFEWCVRLRLNGIRILFELLVFVVVVVVVVVEEEVWLLVEIDVTFPLSGKIVFVVVAPSIIWSSSSGVVEPFSLVILVIEDIWWFDILCRILLAKLLLSLKNWLVWFCCLEVIWQCIVHWSLILYDLIVFLSHKNCPLI